jgi:hypothetical protein
MNRLIISGFVAVALFGAATTLLRSHSLPLYATASSKQLHGSVDVNKLPVEEFEDMSLVYSTASKR